MFSKTIEYKDFNGVQNAQVFYFHMSKAELLEMAADSTVIMDRIKRITEAKDGKAILQEMRELIRMSVGVRSEDGQRFIKDDEARSMLFDSPAYDELLMELSTNAEASADFVRNLIPESMQKEMQAQLAKQTGAAPDPFKDPGVKDERPAWVSEGREPTQVELRNMSQAELVEAFQMRSNRNPQ
jgi:hypothetical protein